MERYELINGCLGMSSVDTLYSHLQKIYIKTKKGEEKSKMLRVTLETKSGSSLSLGKVLSLQVTDDNDCTFFFSLLLTQEDFSVLKCQQGLLVDFDHFPAQLIKLLDACRSQEFSKFILVLDEEDVDSQNNIIPHMIKEGVYLKVIETNNFKNLCHLSLKVVQGSDTDIKNHMSIKIGNLTERLVEEERKFRMSEARLSEALRALEVKTKELTDLETKLREEKNSLKLETSHQISEEREKLTKIQLEWQQKLEIEKSQMATIHQRQITELTEQNNFLNINNKSLYEAKCQLETSVKEKSFHIDTLEKQIFQLTHELTLLKKQNTQLDKDYHEKDKAVVGLKTRLAVMEQELKDKEKLQEKLQELLKAANDQKTFLEEALNEKEGNLQRKQAAVHSLTSDLMKSNEIIAKLQADLAANKAKMKLRTDIALEQEKILEKKAEEMKIQLETIKGLEEKMGKVLEELNSTKTELEEAKKNIEEKDAIIKKNDNVISWLNRRLTESSPPSTATNLISSARTGSDSFVPSQPKGTISNLARGWPPWLVNSVSGANGSRFDSTALNGTARLSNSSSVVESSPDQNSRCRLPKLDENNQPENKDLQYESKNSTTTSNSSDTMKSRGLDPKYFQSCIDKDYITNPHILKPSNGIENWKASTNCKSDSRTPSSNSVRQPNSAYFPKKTLPL